MERVRGRRLVRRFVGSDVLRRALAKVERRAVMFGIRVFLINVTATMAVTT
jgi:hypothetical protein